MSEKRKPWGKWYWGDWRKDARLRRCSYAARGLWADMLSLMGGECDHYGCLFMEGDPLGARDLSGLLGGSEREIQKLINELDHFKVFSRVADKDLPEDVRAAIPGGVLGSTIVSRRMLRDKARDDKDREIGSRGGNPNLTRKPNEGLTHHQTSLGLTPPDNAQSLEARSQRLEKESPPRRSRGDLTAQELREFEEWWQRYPKRVERKAAEKAFAKARKTASLQALVDGADRYARSPKRDPEFTKHPATWLNAGCWTDEDGEQPSGGNGISEPRRPRGPPPTLAPDWEKHLDD